jgi:hypothetical protein
MTSGQFLISTAYLPPVDYFSLIVHSEGFFIEKFENYIKQTYRNRCYILSVHGRQMLTVPVLEGSRHKVRITEAEIDYSKRWQQVHLGAIRSSYRMAPYYQFYSGEIENVIEKRYKYLWELNNDLLDVILRMLKVDKKIQFTSGFIPPVNAPNDFRYSLDPDKEPLFQHRRYFQVFNTQEGFAPNLSIIDLIFNQGPDSGRWLQEIVRSAV